ncbi:MAG: AmmeMemoRadiSam system protein B [Patescibacteria group bacterium]
MRKLWKLNSLILLIIIAALAISWRSFGHSKKSSLSSKILEEITLAQVESAYSAGQESKVVNGAKAAVLPHHLLADYLIGRLIGSLRTAQPTTIIIMGPDHQNKSLTEFSISDANWHWQNQIFEVNKKIVDDLKTLSSVTIDNELIKNEHSVLTPLPFLKKQFPNSNFVILAVKSGFGLAQIQEIANVLNKTLTENDLVIASVDFSHYQNFQIANLEDEKSLKLLEKMIPVELKDVSADSPTSLAIVMEFAKLRSAKGLEIIDHKNSAEISGNLASQSTTSYLDFVFY